MDIFIHLRCRHFAQTSKAGKANVPAGRPSTVRRGCLLPQTPERLPNFITQTL